MPAFPKLNYVTLSDCGSPINFIKYNLRETNVGVSAGLVLCGDGDTVTVGCLNLSGCPWLHIGVWNKRQLILDNYNADMNLACETCLRVGWWQMAVCVRT